MWATTVTGWAFTNIVNMLAEALCHSHGEWLVGDLDAVRCSQHLRPAVHCFSRRLATLCAGTLPRGSGAGRSHGRPRRHYRDRRMSFPRQRKYNRGRMLLDNNPGGVGATWKLWAEWPEVRGGGGGGSVAVGRATRGGLRNYGRGIGGPGVRSAPAAHGRAPPIQV